MQLQIAAKLPVLCCCQANADEESSYTFNKIMIWSLFVCTGANLTMSDLSQYKVHVYPALPLSLRHYGHVIHTVRPPSSGAILAFMLRVLEGLLADIILIMVPIHFEFSHHKYIILFLFIFVKLKHLPFSNVILRLIIYSSFILPLSALQCALILLLNFGAI